MRQVSGQATEKSYASLATAPLSAVAENRRRDPVPSAVGSGAGTRGTLADRASAVG